MALAKVANGSKLLIRIDDAGNPGTFVHRCSINTSRSIEFGSSLAEALIPDCDPALADVPAWLNREIDGLSSTVSGAGMADLPSLNFFWTWFLSGEARNCQIALDVPLADGGGYWQGAFNLSGFTVAGPARREKITFDSTMVNDGPVSWVPA